MLQRNSYTIVLGGIGGDSHSVGIISLNRILQRAGYRVRYLSIQNSIERLVRESERADLVMVSNMDGHTKHYATDLPDLRSGMRGSALWYVGGNPVIDSDDKESIEKLKGLGFDRVFATFVEPNVLIDLIDRDLRGRTPATESDPAVLAELPAAYEEPEVTPVSLATERGNVLASWYTGSDATRWEDNVQAFSSTTHLTDIQRLAMADQRTLIQPRCGVGDLPTQREVFEGLAHAGADVLSFQIDSLTRNNLYEQVELLLKELPLDIPMDDLNGFPMINHGVSAVRDLVQAHPAIPFQVRHSTRDPRLLAEISYAAGIAAFEGGPLCYNIPYYRDYHPAQSVSMWSYVEQLTAEYANNGILIDREYFGVLTATLVPPCIAIAVTVLEALFSASYGVKSVSLGYAEQGHLVQDVTAIWATEDLAIESLAAMGYGGVQVSTVFHQYMAAFPRDANLARKVLVGSAGTAASSGATRLMLKTFVESHHIPAADQNAASLRLVRETVNTTPRIHRGDPLFQGEYERVMQEARAIVCSVLDLPGSLPTQISRAVLQGLIDIPFAPSVWNAGGVMSMRDETGAVRMSDTANLAIPNDLREMHRLETTARLRRDGLSVETAIENDVLSIGRGNFEGWPLALPRIVK